MQAAWERLISWQNALNDDQRLPALLNTMRSNLISMYVYLLQNRRLLFSLRFLMLTIYISSCLVSTRRTIIPGQDLKRSHDKEESLKSYGRKKREKKVTGFPQEHNSRVSAGLSSLLY
jgi:hypothetical protein